MDNGSAETYSVGRFYDTASYSIGNSDGYTGCGNRDFSFSYSPSSTGTLVTNTDQQTFSLEASSTDDFSLGTYTVTVTVSLASDSSITADYTFDVEVLDPCLDTALTFTDSSPNNMEVIIGSTGPFVRYFNLLNSRATQNSDDGYCGDYQCSMTN